MLEVTAISYLSLSTDGPVVRLLALGVPPTGLCLTGTSPTKLFIPPISSKNRDRDWSG